MHPLMSRCLSSQSSHTLPYAPTPDLLVLSHTLPHAMLCPNPSAWNVPSFPPEVNFYFFRGPLNQNFLKDAFLVPFAKSKSLGIYFIA